MGTPGLSGLDKMISHFLAVDMQKAIKFIDKGIKNKTWFGALKECETFLENGDSLKSNNFFYSISIILSFLSHPDTRKISISFSFLGNRSKFLATVNTLVNKAWSLLLDLVLKIGHLQILRQKISYELNTACKFEAKHMEAALRTLNE